MLKKACILLFILCLSWSVVRADMTLVPDGFSFSGGSGRITITCDEVIVTDRDAVAKIVFSSPNYAYVRVDDTEYPTTTDEHTSWAQIPVQINHAFDIQAMTTAMSTPHEITYSIYIRVDSLAESAVPGLKWVSALLLQYAECFAVDYYEGGYALLHIRDDRDYLVVPDGMPVPEGLNPEIVVLQRPFERIYMAATSVMSLFDALDAVDKLRFSSLGQADWYIDGAIRAMESGDLLYAGKYDTPDYESLVREDCDLAIESTMIAHVPKVQELLELLGIPVFVDHSSYERHPLGRTEWIKAYGVLLGMEEAAEAIFKAQADRIAVPGMEEKTGKTLAFFYISTNGTVVVRHPEDYIARMIEMAGGTYVLADMPVIGTSSPSLSLSMEEFYGAAADADYLIYNAVIDTSMASISDLTARNELFQDFKAVSAGRVWTADRRLFQATDTACDLILDIHHMLEEDGAEMTFLRKLE
ncbi:MAG: ABC transporter substrate-binding protein [Clostridia bacterium]|nr:ABC transporter substrate-binding protein [Clostridia bacterium]